MVGTRFTIVFLAVFMLLSMPLTQAANLGKVVYLRLVNDTPDSPTDVYERDLNTGETKLLISHTSLPEDFDTAIYEIDMSPDGMYGVIEEAPGVVITNMKTGDSRRQFGYGYGHSGDEEVTKELGWRHWLWDRATGKISLIEDADGFSTLSWSPTGNYLLISDHESEDVRIYHVPTARDIKIGRTQNPLLWSGSGDGLVEIAASSDRTTVRFRPIGGQPRTMFEWPREIHTIAQSPNGSVFAIFDSRGYYLADRNGKSLTRLWIPKKTDLFSVDFRFHHDGSRLAIFTTHVFGEPHVNSTEQLWAVNVANRTAMRVARWDESCLGSGTVESHWMLGWMPGNVSAVIGASIYYGHEMPADAQNDWLKIRSCDTSNTGAICTQIFDSGKGSIGLDWWSGKTPD